MAMICKDGSMWEPTSEQVDNWIYVYTNINVEHELLIASTWLTNNEQKRKTKRGMSRFCNSWLKRANDKGGSPMAKEAVQTADILATRTRDLSPLDDLTMNISGSLRERRFFIEKYGQCWENGVRYERESL